MMDYEPPPQSAIMDLASIETDRTVEVESGVHLTQLVAGEHVSIQHVRIEPGATIPIHEHHHEQSGFIYQGSFTFVLGDERTETVTAGDSYRFDNHEPHGVVNNRDDTALAIDIFHPPRPNPDWAE